MNLMSAHTMQVYMKQRLNGVLFSRDEQVLPPKGIFFRLLIIALPSMTIGDRLL